MDTASGPSDGSWSRPVEQRYGMRLLAVAAAVGVIVAAAGVTVGFTVHTNAMAQMQGVPGMPALPSMPASVRPPSAFAPPSLPAQVPSAAAAPAPVASRTPEAVPPQCRYILLAEIAQLTNTFYTQERAVGDACWYEFPSGGSPVGLYHQIWVTYYPGSVLPAKGSRVSGVGLGAVWFADEHTLSVRTRHGVLAITLVVTFDDLGGRSERDFAAKVYDLAAPRLP